MLSVAKDLGFFYLFSDVLIGSHLILSMQSNDGMIARLWSGPTTNSTLLLTTGQTVTNGVSIVNGQTINFATHGEVSEVWLQVLAPGTGSISYGFVGTGNAEGISFTDTLSITAYRDKLKVQVMAESDYMAGLGFGPAVNPNINWTQFSVNAIMQSVADFYADPERGLGIDLEWVTTTFTMPTVPHTYAQIDNESIPDLYKYTGDIECVAYNEAPPTAVITNGTMWIFSDMKLYADRPALYYSTYGLGNMSTLVASNRNDELYGDYVKVAFPSRTGYRLLDGRYQTISNNHAVWSEQGAHIDVVSISEEQFIDGKTNYTAQVFVDVLEYCVAHEIFHLIGGWHGLQPIIPPDQPGGIMDSFRPLNLITISPDELLQIDLPNRKSIKK